ncbi:MAG: MFS transporter [Verrucomicrobiota bacterium]
MTEEPSSAAEMDASAEPPRWRRSLSGVLVIQAQNAFNDNLVRFVLIGYAMAAAAGSGLGRDIELVLSILLPIPFVLLAPVAGYASDRFSKRTVILGCLISQVILFAWIGLSVYVGNLLFAIVGFFLLSVQSTFFSPAKTGILKELVGSPRLGLANGLAQMFTTVAILAGVYFGGQWFRGLVTAGREAQVAALIPIGAVGVAALLPFVFLVLIPRTPVGTSVPFRKEVLWSHFTNLRHVLGNPKLCRPLLGIVFYWLVAYFMWVVLVDFARGMFDDTPAGAAEATGAAATMSGLLGVGLIVGSLLVSVMSRKRIQLGLVPVGGLGLTLGLLGVGLFDPAGEWFQASLIFIGFWGSFFLVPLNAYFQDQINPEERGRDLAGLALLTSLAGVFAILLAKGLRELELAPGTQVLLFVLPLLIVTIYVTRIVARELMRLLVGSLLRMIYRVKTLNIDRVPTEGGAVLVGNHMTYVDALLIALVTPANVRFVIVERFAKKRWLSWFLRVFGAIAITKSSPRHALRETAAAAAAGDLVCLFPEGQLIRTGQIHEIKKGYQIVAKQAGVPVMPVHIDGLWGSIFSFADGKFIKKWPRRWPYGVRLNFGELIPGEEATPERVRDRFFELSEEAFAQRPALSLSLPDALREALGHQASRPAVIDRTGKNRQVISRANLLSTAQVLAAQWHDAGAFPQERTRVAVVLPHGSPSVLLQSALVLAGHTPVVVRLETCDQLSAKDFEAAQIRFAVSSIRIRERLEEFPWPEHFVDMGEALQGVESGPRLGRWLRTLFLPGASRNGTGVRTSDLEGEAYGVLRPGLGLTILSHRDLVTNVEQLRSVNLLSREERVLAQAAPDAPGGTAMALWFPLLGRHPLVTVSVAADDRQVSHVAAEERVSLVVARPGSGVADREMTCPVAVLRTAVGVEADRPASENALQGLVEADGGRVISMNVPDPQVEPPASPQVGCRAHSRGRLLPGISLFRAGELAGVPFVLDQENFVWVEGEESRSL